MSCGSARTWRQHTANVLSVKTSWRAIPVCASVRSGFTSSPRPTSRACFPRRPRCWRSPAVSRLLNCLRQQIKTLEKAVTTPLQHTPAYEQLLSVEGIGTILAQTIVLGTGDIGPFPTVGQYASYCRCVTSTKISNGKRKGQGNIKNGNPHP